MGYTAGQHRTFSSHWVRTPLDPVVPSGRLLAKLRRPTSARRPRHRARRGTGSVTRVDSRRWCGGQRTCTLVEQNEEFAAILRRRFPHSPVIQAGCVLARRPCGDLPRIDFIISGLPLLLFQPSQKMRLPFAGVRLAARGRLLPSVHIQGPLSRGPRDLLATAWRAR